MDSVTGSLILTVSLRFVLNRPAGQEAYIQFLHGHPNDSIYNLVHVLELWNAIEDYCQSTDEAYKKKRRKIMWNRYLCRDTMISSRFDRGRRVELGRAIREGKAEKVGDLYLEVRSECLEMLEGPFR